MTQPRSPLAHSAPESPDTLLGLEHPGAFIQRHIGPDPEDVERMLAVVGAASLEELVHAVLPPGIMGSGNLDLPAVGDEHSVLAELRAIASRNQLRHNMIGMGYSDTLTPPVILRNVLENPGWYTAYTPYQAEISQGRLEAMLNFQQLICELTGMDLANASLLDEASAGAEAMAHLQRVNRKSKSLRFLVDTDCLPQTLDVVRTRAQHFGFEVIRGELPAALKEGEFFGVLVQYPGAGGGIPDLAAICEVAHAQGALVAVAADLMSLVLLDQPAAAGADIVFGNSQRFGVPLGGGGPHAAFYATRDEFKRSMPGRMIGVSRDRHGYPALRMALQTREQHIRRDKATSNICTAQALLAVMAGMYAVWHGPAGLERIATRIHRLSCLLASGLRQLGHEPINPDWFDTLTYRLPADNARRIIAEADAAGINLRLAGGDCVGISVNEVTNRQHLATLLGIFANGREVPDLRALDVQLDAGFCAFPTALRRNSPCLTHPVFSSCRSETDMLRYLKRLENRDLSLAHAMIPLGSCTMKLNATAEMLPVSWPEFANIHPFAPSGQVEGYRQLVAELEQMLAACTGYDAVSLQPNAGSQGEYAGLLAIKAWHAARGEPGRNICLIPSSAHGTNPASAAMAGMEVVVVACDANGNVDVADLEAKAAAHGPQLAALMITYPSTHGVYEEAITDICAIVHRHGGQVYLDGANLNALVGYAAPGRFGADVSHLNLHKTFCIPHGGGGPGVGPVCVRAHLAPFLPGHAVVDVGGTHAGNGAVSAAPWGSAGILPIPWVYIRMMGSAGLRRATAVAILSANYIATRLSGAYSVHYTGRGGRVAHECIIDLRPFKQACGISEEDVAKRLIDYGFHSPTMSFPVPGTLMIEPTESEPLAELDRFCDAMLAIRAEIAAVENGQLEAADNPLVNAPHTARDLVDEWKHGYSREQALFPTAHQWQAKFWPAVARVDNVWGDRNLFCACPPPEAWQQPAAEAG